MDSPTIALALAEARVADQPRATHRTATTAPRRHRRRAVLALAATAALAAVPPTGALAQPPHDAAAATTHAARGSDMSPNRIDAADHAVAIRAINLHQLARDTSAEAPAPAAVVRITRVAGDGFDWLDASLGAGLTAALLLGAARVASTRRPRVTTRRAS